MKGARLTQGRTAEIYAWGDRHVLKLFMHWCSPWMAEWELSAARAVQAFGAIMPKVEDEIVEVEGRRGILYERVDGPTMGDVLSVQPWLLFRLSPIMAELHAAVHDCKAPGMRDQRERLERQIQAAGALSAGTKAAVLKRLEQLPGGDALCHGDFHPWNIILSARGPVIIDWMDATGGNPVADVARSQWLARDSALPPNMPATIRLSLTLTRRWMFHLYRRRYGQLRPVTREQIEAWRVPIAAARLSEGIREEEERLVTVVESGLT